ncbi:MAG: hypothetical protein WC612_06005 [Bdellovibrionales bacterium]|jgi:hypothetical protein
MKLNIKPVIPAQAGIPFGFLLNESFHAPFGIIVFFLSFPLIVIPHPSTPFGLRGAGSG